MPPSPALTPPSPTLIPLLLTLVTAVLSASSTSATHEYNRFLITNQYDVALSTYNAGPDSYTYTSTFAHTIQVAQDVYYTTQSIDAKVVSNIVGNTAIVKYQISLDFINQTTIRTLIYGYFELQYFNIFTFRSLLVLPSTPWLNGYMVIQTFPFTAHNQTLTIDLPTQYVPGNNVSTAIMISDIWLQIDVAQMAGNGNKFYLLWTEQLTNSTFSLRFRCPNYFSNMQVRFLVVVIDKTALKQDYIQYKFTASAWWSNITSPDAYIPYSYSFYYQNYVIGLSKMVFSMSADPGFAFSLRRNSGNNYRVDIDYYGLNPSGLSYIYSYAIFPFIACTNPNYPYLNLTDKLCYRECPRLQYAGTARVCSSCRFDCLTCYNDSQCSSCNLTYRYLEPSNFSCLPKDGFYESNDTIPFNCTGPCATCVNNDTFCTSCVANSSIFFVNNTCLLCSYLIEGCETCNSTYCFTCISPYRLVSALYCNLPCQDSHCAVCSNANTSFCYTCTTIYYRANPAGLCVATCGDGYIQDGEQCDDGNSIQHDGCHFCAYEPYYRCYNKLNSIGFNETVYCAYTKPIEFSVISTEKIEYQNRITITITVSQYLQTFWSTHAALSYCFVQSPIPYKNMYVSFIQSHQASFAKLASPLVTAYPTASLMQISFEYLQPIHGQTVNLSFNFNSSTDLALVQIPTYNVSLEVYPENNLAAHLYTQQTYLNQRKLSGFFMFLSIGGLGLLLVSYLVGDKRIMLEMVVIFQVSFMSLASVSVITPLLSSVTTLSLCNNGYNMLANTAALRPVEDTLSDGRVKGMHFYSQFLYNANVGLLMIFVPLLVGMATVVITKMGEFSEEKLKKMQVVYRLALGEWTFIGLVFCGCMVGGSAVFQVRFGMKQIGSMIGLISLIVAGVVLLMYPLYLLMRANFSQGFSEYKEILVDGDNGGLAFQMTYLFLGFLLGAILCAFGHFSLINCVAGGIPFIMFVITLFKPLFKKQFDHYRTQLNLLTLTLIQVPFLYANLSQSLDYSSQSDLNVAMPLFLALILFLNLFGNTCFFAYAVVKRVRAVAMEREKLLKAKGSEGSVHSKQLQQVLKSSLINPLSHLQQHPKEIQGFIEYSQMDAQQVALKQIIRKNYHRVLPTNPDCSLEKANAIEKDYIQTEFDQIDEL